MQYTKSIISITARWLTLFVAPWLAIGTLAADGRFAEVEQGLDPDATETQATARIEGRVELLSENGERLRDRRKFANAVIYFEADDPGEFSPPEEPLVMTTRRREFVPRVLPVAVGTEVAFPNEDPILHNVFSNSSGNPFDLGVYGESPGKSHRFDTPGLVRVFCNVHSRMSAHIVVIDGPHFTQPDRDGNFVLEDLPPGPGRLTLWHERSEPKRTRMTLESDSEYIHNAELELTVREATPPRQRMRRRGRY